ncbi:MAG: hypothetical protein ACI841_001860 [Planctomycetota bacterium]|jgi:hypothetical protein
MNPVMNFAPTRRYLSRFSSLSLLSLVPILFAPEASAQAPVLNPANGHFYQWVPTTMDWPSAKAAAEAMTFQGVNGYLATVTDPGEDNFVYYTLNGGALGNSWLGLWQDSGAPGYAEPAGGWTWVTGEPYVYENWRVGEPNDGAGLEHFGGYWAGDTWNDYQISDGAIAGFVVEYETNVGVNFCTAMANSVGAGALISGQGSVSIAVNTLLLQASGVPDQPGVFYYGSAQSTLPFGNGIRCLGGTTAILNPPLTAAGNQAARIVDMNNLPAGGAIAAGSTWHFQYWYRDPAAGGAAFNLSDGMTVDFLP